MKPRLPRELLEKARELRANPTKAEKCLWAFLRCRQVCGIKFRRQHPIGSHIVDFSSHEARLVVEIDGGQQADANQQLYDAKRTVELEEQGLCGLRFWNNEVLEQTESVVECIRRFLDNGCQLHEASVHTPR